MNRIFSVIMFLCFIINLSYSQNKNKNYNFLKNKKLASMLVEQDSLFNKIKFEFTKREKIEEYIRIKEAEKVKKIREELKDIKETILLESYQLDRKDSIKFNLYDSIRKIDLFRKLNKLSDKVFSEDLNEKQIEFMEKYYKSNFKEVNLLYSKFLMKEGDLLLQKVELDYESIFRSVPTIANCTGTSRLNCFRSFINNTIDDNIEYLELLSDAEATIRLGFLVDLDGKILFKKVNRSSEIFEIDYGVAIFLEDIFKEFQLGVEKDEKGDYIFEIPIVLKN